MNSFFVLFFNLILIIFGVGCTTPRGIVVQNNILPVVEIRKAAAEIMGKPRIVSLNGRELTSFYHDQNFEFLDTNKKYISRYYTKVIILGARRPYDVSVEVVFEKYDPIIKKFVELGLSRSLTRKKVEELKVALAKGLENFQKLDEVMPF